jgi:hypothetical protein
MQSKSKLLKFATDQIIVNILGKYNGNKSKSAIELGISRPNLIERLKHLEPGIYYTPESGINNTGFDQTIFTRYSGIFYLIQLNPKSIPNRIKLGFSNNITRRLQSYHTANPEARLLKQFPCRKYWEKTIIDWIVIMAPCKQISDEVFDFEDINKALISITSLFSFIYKQ